jgi:adenylate kinase
MVRVIIFGAPGAGKGTQADLIEEKFNFIKISTGDLIRAEVNAGTDIGLKVKEVLAKGELVPDDTIIQLLKRRLSQPDITSGYVLDGFPRTLDQARELSHLQAKDEKAIFLEVEADVVVARLLSRLTCKDCGAIFNTSNKPPKVANTCDECGGRLETRPDDNPGTVRQRIAVYREKTEPVIEYYRQKSSLHEVDADGPVESIFERIRGILS